MHVIYSIQHVYFYRTKWRSLWYEYSILIHIPKHVYTHRPICMYSYKVPYIVAYQFRELCFVNQMSIRHWDQIESAHTDIHIHLSCRINLSIGYICYHLKLTYDIYLVADPKYGAQYSCWHRECSIPHTLQLNTRCFTIFFAKSLYQ